MAESRSRTPAASSEKPAESGKSTDKAEAQVQEVVDKETEQGFRGVAVDQTPDHAYTVAGVVAGEDVPEAAADPVQARRDASNA